MSKRTETLLDELESPSAPSTNEDQEPNALDEAIIADLAYRRWVERGCPEGSPDEDWFEAEKELRSR